MSPRPFLGLINGYRTPSTPASQIHIGVDAVSGFVHTVLATAANVADVTQAYALLHGEETVAFGGVTRALKDQGGIRRPDLSTIPPSDDQSAGTHSSDIGVLATSPRPTQIRLMRIPWERLAA